ncbi:ATP-binding cassette domain-containing protein [Thiovibrio sp. JS02]
MATISCKSVRLAHLFIDDWQVEPGEFWCVLGSNGSGKSLLARLLSALQEPEAAETFTIPAPTVWLSFETQQALYEQELYEDDTNFLDQLDFGHTGLELLLQTGADRKSCRNIAGHFGIEGLLGRGCRQFSSGETRKIMLARALLQKPRCLILDEPYDGLDSASARELDRLIGQLSRSDLQLIVMVNQLQDVHGKADRLLLLHGGKVLCKGPAATVITRPEIRTLFQFDEKQLPALPPPVRESGQFPVLVEFAHSQVRYEDTLLFHDLSWQVKPGEHWYISGPNGAGKSTLLALISGDHPQCFQNGVTVFGHKRGSGESVWEIKRNLGIVSSALHRDHRVDGSALGVVASGLYDSIGIYRQVGREEKELALRWLAIVGMAPFSGQAFRALSWGQQRLVLIARALIKQPPLIILDEPTQGLDDLNRHLVLACMERMARLKVSTLLFVSHREDERLPLFRHHLRFEKNQDGPALFRAVIR